MLGECLETLGLSARQELHGFYAGRTSSESHACPDGVGVIFLETTRPLREMTQDRSTEGVSEGMAPYALVASDSVGTRARSMIAASGLVMSNERRLSR